MHERALKAVTIGVACSRHINRLGAVCSIYMYDVNRLMHSFSQLLSRKAATFPVSCSY